MIYRKTNLLMAVSACLVLGCNTRHDNGATALPQSDTVNTKTLEVKPASPTSIMTGAGKIHVDDGGQGNIPVLFLHSFGGSTEHWSHQLLHTRAARRAIAIDLRGHGQSDAPLNEDYSIASIRDDIETVVDSLGLDTFFIVGHSMGGLAGIELAARHPGKVAGLLLLTTPGTVPAAQAKQVISSLEADSYEKVMEDYMSRLLKNASPATNNLERAGMARLSKDVSISIIRASFAYDPVPALQNYKGTTMIVTNGGQQPNSLEKSVPGIPVRTIAGTSHWVQLDKPAEFNQVLDEFFASYKE